MKKIINFAVITLLFLLQVNALASITCHTPRLSKAFLIGKTSVAFYQNDVTRGREIASSVHARTRFTHNGFNKVIKHEGKKYTLHIEDKNNFSEINDYLVIKNNRGHEITYPITCYKK